MLALVKSLGFRIETDPQDPAIEPVTQGVVSGLTFARARRAQPA